MTCIVDFCVDSANSNQQSNIILIPSEWTWIIIITNHMRPLVSIRAKSDSTP